ncbi:MAG: MFS transporter [Planctomycetota bacterium]
MSHETDKRSFWLLNTSQFLGAFNDNAFKQFVLVLALHLTSTKAITLDWWPDDPQPIAMAMFALPFVLFALLGGFFADRFPKRSVIVAMNFVEVSVMGLAMLALYIGASNVNAGVLLVLCVLFLMGTQSAFFGPSKYGSLPELVEGPRLSWANGVVNMSTNLAIIFGTALPVFLFLKDRDLPYFYSGFFFVAVAAIGWSISLFIRGKAAANPHLRFNAGTLAVPIHAIKELRHVAKDKELLLAILAESWFYLIGASILAVLNAYGRSPDLLNLADGGTRLLPFVAGGIALGSITVGKISGPRVELGLVPIGIIGMGVGFMLVAAIDPAASWIQGATFFGTEISMHFAMVAIGLVATGFFGGFYIVPLATLVQQRPAPEEKGRVLGFAQLACFVFIFLSAGVYALMANVFALDPRSMLLTLGWLTIFGAGLACVLSPSYTTRMFLWLLTHTIYRLKVVNPERVPQRGGALLVCNHISYADPFILGSSVPRFVRFLMHRDFLSVPIVGKFGSLMKAIPIADTDSPRDMLKSLNEAAEHAANGGLACIFAEGAISRTGNLLPFSKGLERISKRAQAPIIPVYIDRMWGSVFSYRGGKFFFKWPTRIPYPVSVAFGEPLPHDTPAHQVRREIQELGAHALDLRKRNGMTLATRFLQVAARYPWRFACMDHTNKKLSYFKLLTSVLVLRGLIRDLVGKDEKHVGVLLPPSNGGSIVNVALATLTKVAVNLNFTAGKESLESAIDQCQIKHILTSREFLKKAKVEERPEHVFLEDLVKKATGGGKLKAALIAALCPRPILIRLPGVCRNPDEDATVIFSSGSTGMPKGVCLTHHNILSNARSLAQVFNVTKHDKMVGVLPFFHSFGYTATLWFPFLSGFTALFHPNPIDAARIGEIIREERGTIFVSTPTFYLSYLRRWSKEDFATIRIAVSGAEKLKESLLQLWIDKFGKPILQGYGCTELSPAASINLPDVISPSGEQVGHKPGTIGHPLPGIAVKIVDPDTLEDRPQGDEGLILVKGPNVMRCYLGQPELTAEVIRDGWYVTGDIGRLDNDGFISITDRQSRFSKIGGEMVPHVRVEEVVQKHVDQLQPESTDGPAAEVAVTSVADDAKGERLVVIHTPLGVEIGDLLDAVRGEGLPNLWIPRKDAFLEVEEIPKLASGKLNLRAIKDLAAGS